MSVVAVDTHLYNAIQSYLLTVGFYFLPWMLKTVHLSHGTGECYNKTCSIPQPNTLVVILCIYIYAIVVVDHFYIVLLSTIEQTHCTRM